MESSSPLIIIVSLISLVALAGIVFPFKPFKKRWRALLVFLVCFLLIGILLPPPDGDTPLPVTEAETTPEGMSWVTSDRLNRRTCPSTRCGVVGQFFFREAARILETKNGWARISGYYDASCVNGRSEYVDEGNAECNPDNGIVDGRLAEWVSTQFLSETLSDVSALGPI